MFYTVGEMAKRLNVAPSTLRFYDKAGLLPFVERSSSGIRMFSDKDFEWLQIINCLKKAGMKLSDIKTFIELAMKGDTTIESRLELIIKQKKEVESQIEVLKKTLLTLQFKEWYYTAAQKDMTTERVRNLSSDELPQKFREIRKELKGE